jgi:hypothetical protein
MGMMLWYSHLNCSFHPSDPPSGRPQSLQCSIRMHDGNSPLYTYNAMYERYMNLYTYNAPPFLATSPCSVRSVWRRWSTW